MNKEKEIYKEPKYKRLYRAVGCEEFYSIMKTNRFSFHPKGVDVKYFGLDFKETLDFADELMNIDLVAVVEVIVLEEILNKIGDFIDVDPFLFKTGTIEIQSEHLDEFNSAIYSIIHRF